MAEMGRQNEASPPSGLKEHGNVTSRGAAQTPTWDAK